MISVQFRKIICVTKFLRFQMSTEMGKDYVLNRNAGDIEINSRKTLFSRLLGI